MIGLRKAWVVLAIFICKASFAAGQINFLGTWSDPLATTPRQIEQGRPLPGELVPQRCPATGMGEAPLGLTEAVDIALCNNPKIRSTWLGIKVQAAELGLAKAAFLPTISSSVGRQHSVSGYPGAALSNTSVSGSTLYTALNWRLFDFGARAAERESANHLLVAAIQSHDATLQNVMEETVQAYFDVQNARAALRAKEEGREIAAATLDSATRREGSGVAGHGDTLQAATARARAELELHRADGDFRKAYSILVYAMGLSANTRILLAEIDIAANVADSSSEQGLAEEGLDAWLNEVQLNHPAILAARSRWQAALDKVRSTKAAALPTVDFAANYYKNGYPNQGISAKGSHVATVGISLSIPIFSGFSRNYQLRQTEALAQQREADAAKVEHEVLMELVKAYADARSALENLNVSASLLSVAQDALASSQRKYNKGAADIVEVLNAQKELAEAKRERVRAVGDWHLGRLRLMAAAGQLGYTDFTAAAMNAALRPRTAH